MKIAFVTNRAAHYCTPFFRILAKQFDVHFYFTATSTGRWWTSAHQENTEGLEAVVGLSSGSLRRRLKAGGYDCVVSSLGGRTHLAATASAVREGGLPFVLWVDMWRYPRTIIHTIGRPLTRHLLRRADTIVSCGSHISRWIEGEVGRTDDVFHLGYAVDNHHFSTGAADEQSRARQTLGLDLDAVGCFVGRLEREKGLPILLRALNMNGNGTGLLIAGSGSQEGTIDATVDEMGLGKRVRRFGWLDQAILPGLYHASDFMVIPSISTRLVTETWGLVANEAMSAGLPVIASDAVGAAAGGLVTNEETGLVVPERNVEALADAIHRLSVDVDLRQRLGEAAQARVSAFTFESCANTFVEAIRSAISLREEVRQ